MNHLNISGTVKEISEVKEVGNVMHCHITMDIPNVRVKVACEGLLATKVIDKIKPNTQAIIIGKLGYVEEQEIGVIASAIVQDNTTYPEDYPKEVLTRELSKAEHQTKIAEALENLDKTANDVPF